MDWTPLHDKLLVRRDPPETQIGTLVVADAYKKQQNVGTVIKAGDGRWMEGILLPLTVQPGMRVIFSKFAGTELAADQPDLIILREDEILAYSHD